MMEEYIDEWPDQDIVRNIVENEEEIYVDEYLGDDEEDEYAGFQPTGEVENYHDEWFEDEDDYNEDAPITKEYARDPDSVTVS